MDRVPGEQQQDREPDRWDDGPEQLERRALPRQVGAWLWQVAAAADRADDEELGRETARHGGPEQSVGEWEMHVRRQGETTWQER